MIGFNGYVFPVFVSVSLHAALVFFAVWGWQQAPRLNKVHMPQHIQATLVELKPKSSIKPKAVKPESGQKPQKKKVDLAAKRKAQAQKLLAEKKRQAALNKKKAQQKAQEKKAEAAKKLAEKRKQEQKAEKARQEQEKLAQKKAFEQALLEEEGLLLEEESAEQAQSYSALIASRIEQYWSRPPSTRNGMRCELAITMVPSGRVVDVNITKSSGNPAFDRSAVAAVKKIETFPEIKNMPIDVFERHFRTFTLGFQPEDLRQ